MDEELKDLLQSYKTPARAAELINNTKIVFLVGISGAGKDTLLRELLKSDDYRLIISHTTRKPRANQGVLEKDGVDYNFIDFSVAKKMLQNMEFVEAKRYSDNVYGTSIAEIERINNANRIAISDLEVQGVVEYRAVSDKVTPIFILPPDYATWQKRLMARYQGVEPDANDIEKRINTATNELQEALSKDYYQFVINDDIQRTIEIVDEIAHGNFSDAKNEKATEIARKLLLDLENVAKK